MAEGTLYYIQKAKWRQCQFSSSRNLDVEKEQPSLEDDTEFRNAYYVFLVEFLLNMGEPRIYVLGGKEKKEKGSSKM